MRNPSRLFSALIVSIALLWAGGCGSKDESANNPNSIPEPRGEAPSSSNSAAPPAEASYQLDPAKHVLPSGPVSGVLGGEKVTAEVRLEGQRLILRKPETAGGAMWQIWIDLPPDAHRGGTTRLVIGPDRMPPLKVMVEYPMEIATKEWEFFSFRGWEPKKLHAWEGGCSMTLEMGKREKGKVAGKIYLALAEIESRDPAARQSFLAGSFVADCTRLPTEPPGVDDVPLINGNIAVKQAPAGAVLRVGFAATPTPSTFALGGTDIQLGEPIDPPRSSQASTDPPSVSTLIAGDGKTVPSRYEHSKLAPGRYLVFAQLKDGPAAWKWVEVRPQSTTGIDLEIDARQVGGVEVTVPVGILGKVQVAPADESTRASLSPELFMCIALQMNLERDIISRKALFTNLAPGRYEVRAGNQSRGIEIVAGKIQELDFDKPAGTPSKK